MSCELKAFVSVLILSAIALHLICRSFSSTPKREDLGYSGESSFSRVLYDFASKTGFSPQLQSDASEFKATNPNGKRFRRASSKLQVTAGFPSEKKKETLPLQSNKSTYEFRSDDSAAIHSNTENATLTGLPKRALEIESGFQGDAPAFGRLAIPGKFYASQSGSSSQSTDMEKTLPKVHCSEEVMTLTATGKDYTNIFVDRVDAAPLHLFQVPAYCGYSVRVTWEDLVLIVPYDGCYIIQENGSYVLSLLWWGSPIKISCPMTPVNSEPTPSVLCSHFGMVIKIEGARDAAEKHRVKVNGKILPLLSETCAYRIHSPPEVVLLHTVYSSRCVTVTDKENILDVILDGSQFTLSCPFPHHLIPFLPYLYSHPYHKSLPPAPIYPKYPLHHPAPLFDDAVDQIPQTQEETVPQDPTIPPPQYSPHPVSCPPYPEKFCSQYPMPYHQPAVTTASQPTIQPWTSFPQTTYNPLASLVMQKTPLPVFPTTPSTPPSQMSPSLNCMRNKIMATLPSAKEDSIKVKDTETKTWISIASVQAACNYTLHSRDGSVVLSSPLPSCHTKKMSSTVISLSVRFWDLSQLRYRTLQLQCQYTEDIDTQPLHQIIPQLTTEPTATQPPSKFEVLCSSQHMSVKLPPGPTSSLYVQDPSNGMKTEAVSILEAPSHCGYSVKRDQDGTINILLPYSSCHMTQKDGLYRIILKYQTPKGLAAESLLSCQVVTSQECNVAPDQQLVCGSGALSSSECHDRGCCYSADTQSCHYPMDECTMDRHFVFSIHSSAADPPLSPASLVTAGDNPCTPQKVTADWALFKIPLDECGAHRYEVGKTVVYMVEILNRVQPLSLSYGTITRESPVRLLVECRYLPGSVISVGYLVKSPSLGPSIKAQGVFGVQLRIAKDELYIDFYPQYHQPLRMLLGKPLYLEVRLLNPPDPTAVLLVHYCVAYPRSAKSAWILIYDGCPNFLDQTPTHKPPATPEEALINHVRRFTITTFQFLPEDADLQTDEEIYFMCSTEVCLPSDGPCVEGCFTGECQPLYFIPSVCNYSHFFFF
ncbi:uncharacterized protein LOC128018981 isoform X1 [Carassius gibelio]|uniref:uncharacterized protein LOC128018981 isoform X1 n=1 Tax=Carassius gibelio TaxID=101364 RepID=UPI002278BD4A|nr:uncharacterized protein LOC128018981 isoform X1 [Carassius gibelio]